MKIPSLRPLLLLLSFATAIAVGGGAAAADAPAPITPREPTTLFNGKDLSGFYTWENVHGREDPDHVFTVVEQIDGAPAIRISGQHFGGMVTKARYTNYRLVTEFRWGLVTWEPRKNKTRDSGILLHCQGEDGNNTKDFRAPWMRSVEFQIIEGGTGDIILVGGYERDRAEPIVPALTTSVRPGTSNWDPQGTPAEFKKGRIDWQHRDPEWKDVLGFRGRKDVEKPAGGWNHLEAICDGGNFTYFVNGVKVNEGRNGAFTAGPLLFQSEGAEIFFRRIELHPLKN